MCNPDCIYHLDFNTTISQYWDLQDLFMVIGFPKFTLLLKQLQISLQAILYYFLKYQRWIQFNPTQTLWLGTIKNTKLLSSNSMTSPTVVTYGSELLPAQLLSWESQNKTKQKQTPPKPQILVYDNASFSLSFSHRYYKMINNFIIIYTNSNISNTEEDR